jgi:hypothetical protein
MAPCSRHVFAFRDLTTKSTSAHGAQLVVDAGISRSTAGSHRDE